MLGDTGPVAIFPAVAYDIYMDPQGEAPQPTSPSLNETAGQEHPKSHGVPIMIVAVLAVIAIVACVGAVFFYMQSQKLEAMVVDLEAQVGALEYQVEFNGPQTGDAMMESEEPQDLLTYTSTQVGELNFALFTLEHPASWTLTDDVGISTDNSRMLTLEKNGHVIEIYQAPMGGGFCLFDDSPPVEGPAGDYRDVSYAVVNAPIGAIRYFVNEDLSTTDNLEYTVCMQQPGSENFGSPIIGGISLKTPVAQDPMTFDEMNAILRSIRPAQ